MSITADQLNQWVAADEALKAAIAADTDADTNLAATKAALDAAAAAHTAAESRKAQTAATRQQAQQTADTTAQPVLAHLPDGKLRAVHPEPITVVIRSGNTLERGTLHPATAEIDE